jgi:rhodanese-related sulfurtransferase
MPRFEMFGTLSATSQHQPERNKTMLKRLAIFAILSTAAMAQQAATPAAGPGGPHPQRPASKAKVLTNVELDGYLAHPDKVLLVDVRRPDEISTIGGFPVYLSVQIKDLKEHLAEIPRDRPIITVSNHAARAGSAADTLAEAGFKVIGAVGADTYQKDGGTKAVKIAVPAPRPGGAEGTASAAQVGEGTRN